QDAPAAARDQERDDDGAVVLPQVEVVPLEVEQPILLPAEAVNRLVRAGQPLLWNVLGALSLDDRRHDGAAAVLLLEDGSAGRVEERHPTRGEIDADPEPGRGERRRARVLGQIELRAVAALW